jgi:hypothetical protein
MRPSRGPLSRVHGWEGSLEVRLGATEPRGHEAAYESAMTGKSIRIGATTGNLFATRTHSSYQMINGKEG